ncbi:MAG: quinone-dependent dihydroorotate dehydrogenase [Pseudomonadales bacterium]|nr:quinone-dependent dihydroorotate dehydrogenase [Pseudomonadales bacterium]
MKTLVVNFPLLALYLLMPWHDAGQDPGRFRIVPVFPDQAELDSANIDSDSELYRFIRFFLFLLPEEFSHHLSLEALKWLHRCKLSWLLRPKSERLPVSLFGLNFPNPVGLAAGLDKNGDYLDALGALGFGFVEIGTVTPKPQPGNPKPRLFRLPEHEAIINRMGFNNKGLDYVVERLKSRHYRGIVGVNIGKNYATPVTAALSDYLLCLRGVYAHADYVVINLSSPNTPGLRSLQFGESLHELLAALKKEQADLQEHYRKYVPLLVKISPDLEPADIEQIAAAFLLHGIDGVIATNTTIARGEALQGTAKGREAGGLSGAPLTAQATWVLTQLKRALAGKIPVIGVGGIMDGASGLAKLQAGATLLQIYTGFIYHGPALIAAIVEQLQTDRQNAASEAER